jgi:hypothetical protein
MTCRLELTPDAGTPSQGTRLGGVPWWPATEERPRCPSGHLMAFIGQFRMADGPASAKDPGLLSFHYCQECAHAGGMSFGHGDADNRGYEVRLFGRPSTETDGQGIVAPSPIQSASVRLSCVEEIPHDADIDPAMLEKLPLPEGEDQWDERSWGGLTHVMRSKLGGWPSWQQDSDWPQCREGRRMNFVAQIDYAVGCDAPWANGGYAYLFVCPDTCRVRHGELSIQTT